MSDPLSHGCLMPQACAAKPADHPFRGYADRAVHLGYSLMAGIVGDCGLSESAIKLSNCVDQDERVKSDSGGAVPNCKAMTQFDTGSAMVNLCTDDSWVTSQGAPAGWVHSNCPVTCGLCVPSNTTSSTTEIDCLAMRPTITTPCNTPATTNQAPATNLAPTPAPTPAPKAPEDTPHFVTLTVTMPYTKAQFDQDKQDKYKAAVASAANTDPANVEILSITEGRRREGSVQVETKVRRRVVEARCQPEEGAARFAERKLTRPAPTCPPVPPCTMQIRATDAEGATQLTETLGTGEALLTKINTKLEVRPGILAENMSACMGVGGRP